jgi:hypothetical protein
MHSVDGPQLLIKGSVGQHMQRGQGQMLCRRATR